MSDLPSDASPLTDKGTLSGGVISMQMYASGTFDANRKLKLAIKIKQIYREGKRKHFHGEELQKPNAGGFCEWESERRNTSCQVVK